MNRAKVMEKLRDHVLLLDGHRNDDCVNLAIVACMDCDCEVDDEFDLEERIKELIEVEGLMTTVDSDMEYLHMKCATLFNYIFDWYDTGDMYDYAFI